MEKLDYYEGQVLDGKFHGKGKLTNPDGIIVEGTFNNGFLDGETHVSLPDGRKYLLLMEEGKTIKSTLLNGKKQRPRHPGKRPLDANGKPLPDPRPKGSIFPF